MRRGFHIVSKTQLRALAKNVLSRIARDPRAQVILLSGNLGSGKTAFVQIIATMLGIREAVLSPTFVFIHEHQIATSNLTRPSRQALGKRHATRKNFPFKKLIHVDAYRIETKRDFDAIGLRRYLKDPENLILVEWGERVRKWLPRPDFAIEFKHHTPKLRKVRLMKK